MKIKDIKELVKLIRDNKGFQDDVSYYSFIISLLPIPGLQQAGLVLNKLSSDHKLKLEFDELKEIIEQNNERITEIEDEVIRINKYASVLDSDAALDKLLNTKIQKLISKLEEDSTEFEVETENWSTQVLIKQIIEADLVSISAIDNSINVIKDSKIKAKKTKLTAKNRSTNYIDGTELSGESGKVNMNGIAQGGNVTIEDNSVTLNQGGLDFGGGTGIFGSGTISGGGQISVTRTVKCPNPNCGQTIEIGNAQFVQCKNCNQRIRIS
jgi:hypothetical protein